MNDLKIFLRGLPAFERFNDRQLDALITQLAVEQHPAGTVLYEAGMQGRALFIVMKGAVGVDRTGASAEAEQTYDEMHAGEVVGRLALVPDMPAMTRCWALSDITVAALSPESYNALFLLAPAIAHQFQYMVAARLAQDLQARNQLLRQRLVKSRPAKAPSLLERIFGV